MSTEVPRRSSSNCSSDFEFWMVGNPSCPQPHLLTADELFFDGVILPLHHLNPSHPQLASSDHPDPEPDSIPTIPTPPIRSKRSIKDSIGSHSELINIHIWPFSRSRSTANLKTTASGTNASKASSAPCSRSNSQGESSKKLGGAKVLNLNINTCIGYGHQVNCSDDDNDAVAGDECSSGGGNGERSLSRLKTIFSKKVH